MGTGKMKYKLKSKKSTTKYIPRTYRPKSAFRNKKTFKSNFDKIKNRPNWV